MKTYRVLVIGAVHTTALTLKGLVRHGFDVLGVLGHEPDRREAVSGWTDLRQVADQQGIEYRGFRKINESDHLSWARSLNPDIIFAVGFSQLLSEEWLMLPKLGCIGFHPTALPRGRGRAPLAWTVLEMEEGSASYFLMGAGADDGPVFNQVRFQIENHDDAGSVMKKIESAIDTCLNQWLPELKRGVWNPIPQDDGLATWYGKRGPEDGRIDWLQTNYSIDRLVKASTRPHPGAYTFYRDRKITIWSTTIEDKLPIRGVVGRILLVDPLKGALVQCGVGLIWIMETGCPESDNVAMRVGDKLGYSVEDEIHELRNQLRQLNDRIRNE